MLPREFSAVVITAVYIPSGTNANANAKGNVALSHLHSICNHQKQYPEAVHIIGGDFNRTDLKAVSP